MARNNTLKTALVAAGIAGGGYLLWRSARRPFDINDEVDRLIGALDRPAVSASSQIPPAQPSATGAAPGNTGYVRPAGPTPQQAQATAEALRQQIAAAPRARSGGTDFGAVLKRLGL